MWQFYGSPEDANSRGSTPNWLFVRSYFVRKLYPSFDFFYSAYFTIKGVQFGIQFVTAFFVLLVERNFKKSSVSSRVLIPFHLYYFLANALLFIFCTFFNVKKVIFCFFEILTVIAGIILSSIIFSELTQTDKEMRQVSLVYLPAAMLFSSLISLCCAQDFVEDNAQLPTLSQPASSEGSGSVHILNTPESFKVVINSNRPPSELVYSEDHPLHGTRSISRASTVDLSTLNPTNQDVARAVPPETASSVPMPVYCGFDSRPRSFESLSNSVEVIIPVHGQPARVWYSASGRGQKRKYIYERAASQGETSGGPHVALNVEQLRLGDWETRERVSGKRNVSSKERRESRKARRNSSSVLPPAVAILAPPPPPPPPEVTQRIGEERAGVGTGSEENGNGERRIGNLPSEFSSE